MKILQLVSISFWLTSLTFILGYTWEYGKGLAQNKTKKVCDLCFREISVWNKKVKEFEDNKK